MTVMYMFLLVLGVLIVVLGVVLGVVTLTTGWVPRGARRRVVRPELSGYGTLLGAVGFGLFDFLGPLGESHGYLPLLGIAIFLTGSGLQIASQHPGRIPPADVTKDVA